MHKYVKLWIDNYAKQGYPDQRSVQDFVECETKEFVEGLRQELGGISRGNYIPETLDQMVGKSRIARHGSYEEWASLMLQWIAAYLKH